MVDSVRVDPVSFFYHDDNRELQMCSDKMSYDIIKGSLSQRAILKFTFHTSKQFSKNTYLEVTYYPIKESTLSLKPMPLWLNVYRDIVEDPCLSNKGINVRMPLDWDIYANFPNGSTMKLNSTPFCVSWEALQLAVRNAYRRYEDLLPACCSPAAQKDDSDDDFELPRPLSKPRKTYPDSV